MIDKEHKATYKNWIQRQISLATAIAMSLLMKYCLIVIVVKNILGIDQLKSIAVKKLQFTFPVSQGWVWTDASEKGLMFKVTRLDRGCG